MATFLAPKTFADGDYLTFTELNATVGNNSDLHWLKNALAAIGISSDSATQTVESAIVGCRVLGTNQQIPDSQWTEISWSQQRWGRWNGQDINFLLSDRPTFLHLPQRPYRAVDGRWLIGAHIAWAGNTTGQRGLRIVSHGNRLDLTSTSTIAEKHKAATGSGGLMGMSITTQDDGNSGGTNYSVQVYQDTGDVLEIQVLPGGSPEAWMIKTGSDWAT